MRNVRRPGGPNARLVVPIVFLLIALGLAAALAWQALQAERSHREVAERTLWDYANFAAFILGSRIFEELQPQVEGDLDVVRRVAIGDLAPDAMDTLLRPCADGRGPARWAFHLNLSANRFETWGTVPPGAADWARDTIWADVKGDEAGRFSFAHVFGRLGGEPVALVYGAQRDVWDEPVRAYGLTPCFERNGRSVFQTSLAGPPALPPTLTEPLPNDSLLSVRVVDPLGTVVWASPRQFPDRYTGTNPVWGPFGGLELRTALRPGLADRLVTGGIPRSRFPLTMGLLGLAAVLVLTAVVQLRRGHELARLREGFVSSVSHELRTPLQQVLLFVELLRMGKLRTAQEETRSLEIVEEETRRLIHLVENLLQFSRGGRGELRVMPRVLELAPLVRETVEAFGPLARARRAKLVCDLEPAEAWADPDAVRRILLNLLDNAVKYGPEGQTVSVGLQSRNGSAVLHVEDEGDGIPTEERSRIWEPFYRARRDGAAETGSGIGLSIVRELVALQGGEVGVERGPRGGARFVVVFPVDRPEEET